MKRRRFTEEQIIGILREQEAGAKAADLARKHGVSEATLYNWKAPPALLAGHLDQHFVAQLGNIQSYQHSPGRYRIAIGHGRSLQKRFEHLHSRDIRPLMAASCSARLPFKGYAHCWLSSLQTAHSEGATEPSSPRMPSSPGRRISGSSGTTSCRGSQCRTATSRALTARWGTSC